MIDFAERSDLFRELAADPKTRAVIEAMQEYDDDLRGRLLCLYFEDLATFEQLMKGCPNGFAAAYRRYLETEDLTELLSPLAEDPLRADLQTRSYAAFLLFCLGELPGC